MVEPDRLPFPLETILSAGDAPRSLTACNLGHLVVAGRTHWKPVGLTADLRNLVCDWVEHEADDA
jgi:hypothetical protein